MNKLTKRQIQVLGMLYSGKSRKEVAYELGLSYQTVRLYMSLATKRANINTIGLVVAYERMLLETA